MTVFDVNVQKLGYLNVLVEEFILLLVGYTHYEIGNRRLEMTMPRIILIAIFLFSSNISRASETKLELNKSQSKISFISVKKEIIAEINYFNKFNVSLSDNGQFILTIDLTSVDTHIPVRDNRIKNFLFETIRFPQARFQGSVSPAIYTNLKSGQFVNTIIKGSLYLHGIQKEITVPVKIIKLANGQLNVFNTERYLLNANSFGLKNGIDKLKSLAKLNAINAVIPISFDFYFK